MRKKYSALLLTILLLTTTACSNKDNNSDSTSTSDKVTSSITESDSSSETATAPKIHLSGNPNDTFVAQSDCYVESDKVILFIQKGVTVKGDAIRITEKVMNDLTSSSGMTFDKNYTPESTLSDWQERYFDKNSFTNINSNMDKINVLIVNLENDEIQWATDNIAALDQKDFDYNNTYYTTIYHELSHVLQFRNGVSLGSVMNEGFATYLADTAGRMAKYPIWDSVQFYYPANFDSSIITSGEKSFKYMYDDRDNNYNYGIRFITFLNDTYGKDLFKNILSEATKQGFSSGWGSDNEEADKKNNTESLIKIIKSQTSNDVFDKFAKWYEKNWSIKGKEYVAYMKSIGQDIPDYGN